MPQATENLPHMLSLDARHRLTLTGATEEVSFDETAVVVGTNLGTLVIQGRDLSLKELSLDGGRVEVLGEISALNYAEPRQNSGWLRRLFG